MGRTHSEQCAWRVNARRVLLVACLVAHYDVVCTLEHIHRSENRRNFLCDFFAAAARDEMILHLRASPN